MSSQSRWFVRALVGLVLACAVPATAGQGQGRAGGRQATAPVVTPIETQRLFDAYVLVQAQDALGVSDALFPEFLTRLKALQDARRRHLQARHKIVLDLQALTNPNAPQAFDEARTRELLRSLGELDARAVEDVRKAQEALDQLLDVRQQARFRVFEDQVERRKLDLLIRARRAAAGRENAPLANPDKKK